MNRAERRRRQREKEKIEKEPVINVKVHDLERVKDNATHDATTFAFTLMLGLPIIVMRDKHGWGKVRCERLINQVLELYEAFNEGYITLDDIHRCLWEEAGIKIHREGVR